MHRSLNRFFLQKKINYVIKNNITVCSVILQKDGLLCKFRFHQKTTDYLHNPMHCAFIKMGNMNFRHVCT